VPPQRIKIKKDKKTTTTSTGCCVAAGPVATVGLLDPVVRVVVLQLVQWLQLVYLTQ